jgi:hypothetical protein
MIVEPSIQKLAAGQPVYEFELKDISWLAQAENNLIRRRVAVMGRSVRKSTTTMLQKPSLPGEDTVKINSQSLTKIWEAMRVLTDENGNSGQYMRECSRTSGTPYKLDEIFYDLDRGVSENVFQDKYWVCFQATHLSMLEDAARANAREAYRGYHIKQKQADAARETIKFFDDAFVNLETRGAL